MAALDVIQQDSGAGGEGSSLDVAYTSSVTSGNDLWAWVQISTSGDEADATVSDDVNGSWTRVDILACGDAGSVQLWRYAGAAAGTTTVTLNSPDYNSFLNLHLYEIEGGTSPEDYNIDSGGFNADLDSGDITTTTATTLLLGYGAGGWYDASPFSEPTDWTEDADQDGTRDSVVAHRLVTSAGTYSYETTASAVGNWGCGIAALAALAAANTRRYSLTVMGVG